MGTRQHSLLACKSDSAATDWFANIAHSNQWMSWNRPGYTLALIKFASARHYVTALEVGDTTVTWGIHSRAKQPTHESSPGSGGSWSGAEARDTVTAGGNGLFASHARAFFVSAPSFVSILFAS